MYSILGTSVLIHFGIIHIKYINYITNILDSKYFTYLDIFDMLYVKYMKITVYN